jgi:hypothetical protein
MPATTASVPVNGSVSDADGGPQFVLAARLEGHDTFLTGVLQVGDARVTVRIITLDDVTVLRPVERGQFAGLAADCAGVLHLPHGSRRRTAPADLSAAARRQVRSLAHLDDAEMRYALTFLEEATTDDIRRARIDAIVTALPEDAATTPRAETTSQPAGGPQDVA